MRIRQALETDAEALADVFFRAVREGPSPYSDAQRAAWLPAPPDTADFAARLAAQHVVLAEVAGAPVGFMTLDAEGYVDLAFILPTHRGRGVFRALCDAVERRARQQAATRLSTHASLMAQPAFRAVGFAVIHHETVERAGQELPRALMEKRLS